MTEKENAQKMYQFLTENHVEIGSILFYKNKKYYLQDIHILNMSLNLEPIGNGKSIVVYARDLNELLVGEKLKNLEFSPRLVNRYKGFVTSLFCMSVAEQGVVFVLPKFFVVILGINEKNVVFVSLRSKEDLYNLSLNPNLYHIQKQRMTLRTFTILLLGNRELEGIEKIDKIGDTFIQVFYTKWALSV